MLENKKRLVEAMSTATASGLTLGSLFDGSGGFPLGGLLSGIRPVWASEIEPFPIRVTTKRLPFIKHYGDVSKMSGGEIEPVDIITFGSPCQDMSVVGKRAGLDGSRSNLFYEAVRIVREMRCATDGKKPRYIVWENVPGAFSSNKGEDFKAVLEAVCKIKDETCDVPKCKKWESAGEILGDNFSVAWRVLDAQYWGVPQRRRRIYLVADFAGRSAGEILFEQPCVSGDFAESGNKGQGAAEDVERSVGSAIAIDAYNHAVTGDITVTLTASSGSSATHSGPMCIENHPIVMNERQYALTVGEDVANILTGTDFKGTQCVFEPKTLKIRSGYTVRRLTPTECARLQGFPDDWCCDLGTENPAEDEILFWTEVWETHRKIMGKSSKPKTRKQIIKWLNNPHSDSAEYKMWGNGVALPCVYFVLTGIVSYTVSVDELVNSESEAESG